MKGRITQWELVVSLHLNIGLLRGCVDAKETSTSGIWGRTSSSNTPGLHTAGRRAKALCRACFVGFRLRLSAKEYCDVSCLSALRIVSQSPQPAGDLQLEEPVVPQLGGFEGWVPEHGEAFPTANLLRLVTY